MEVFSPFSLQTAFLYLNNILPQIAPMGACPAARGEGNMGCAGGVFSASADKSD
jgi:hypothetical protein